LIEEVGLQQRHLVEEVLNAPDIGCAQAPHDAKYFVTFVEQEFAEIRPILAGDARDQCAFLVCHKSSILHQASRRMTADQVSARPGAESGAGHTHASTPPTASVAARPNVDGHRKLRPL